MQNIETEVRFLEIDVEKIREKLLSLGAIDHGKKFLSEVIIQEPTGSWIKEHKRLRVRQQGDRVTFTYKEGSGVGMQMIEHEVEVSDYKKTVDLLLATGFTVSRSQEKYRHSYTLHECTIDIDDWPGIPTYLEIEGSNIDDLKSCADKLEFDWDTRYEKDAMCLILENYGLDLKNVSEFTFDNLLEIQGKMK